MLRIYLYNHLLCSIQWHFLNRNSFHMSCLVNLTIKGENGGRCSWMVFWPGWEKPESCFADRPFPTSPAPLTTGSQGSSAYKNIIGIMEQLTFSMLKPQCRASPVGSSSWSKKPRIKALARPPTLLKIWPRIQQPQGCQAWQFHPLVIVAPSMATIRL